MWFALPRLNRVLRDAASRRIWSARPLTWALRSGVQVRLESYAEWVVYNDIFVEGEYDWALDQALSRARARAFILDLGANVGLFAWRAMDRALRGEASRAAIDLLLIEGSPRLAHRLVENMRNVPASMRVDVVAGLVGPRTGTGVLQEGAFHVANRVVDDGSVGTAVPYVDLERVVAPKRRIDLLKCDIEGSELRFVETYPQLLRKVDCAVFEFHRRLCDVELCRRRIIGSGLRSTRVERTAGDISVEVFWR